MKFHRSVLYFLLGVLVGAGQIVRVNADEVLVRDEQPDLSGLSVEELVEGLGAEEFVVREAAQRRLMELDAISPEEVADACFAAFEQSDDPEVRMRARKVLLEHVQYYEGQFGGRGFIGIRLGTHRFFTPDGDWNFAVMVGDVMEGLPGELAGLEPNDLILAVDDVSLNTQQTQDTFVEYVSGRRPGSKIILLVQRGLQPPQEIEITLIKRPDDVDENTVKEDPEEMLQQWLVERRMKVMAEESGEVVDSVELEAADGGEE